jgi:hypothetical protein
MKDSDYKSDKIPAVFISHDKEFSFADDDDDSSVHQYDGSSTKDNKIPSNHGDLESIRTVNFSEYRNKNR